MKKSLPLFSTLLCFIILLGSCATNKDAVSERRSDFKKSKETENVCFVQLKDGSTVTYSSLKLVNAVFNDAYLLADNKKRIYPKEINAYQNKDHYAVSQNILLTGHKSYVSVEALPGFAVRIAKGKINVYCKKFYNGSHAVDEFFLQSGDGGAILAYTPELVNELLKDNTEAVNLFNNTALKKINLALKLKTTMALVNNDLLVSKN